MFGKHKKQGNSANTNSAVLDITIGNELIFHGQTCEIINVKAAEGTTFARLNFSVVNGKKTGIDGWYDVVKLQKDPKVCNSNSSDRKKTTLPEMNAF